MKNAMFIVQIIIVIALLCCFFGCCTKSKKIDMNVFNEIYDLVDDNICFYKGVHGAVWKGVFTGKYDTMNILYSSCQIIYKGKNREEDEFVYIKDPDNPTPLNIPLETITLPQDGILILFRKDYVYILNFSSDEFYKFPRVEIKH